ncbi:MULTISPECIES: hypothetical protein [Staphylococcus]|uniref:hypothetical protein n=1 Tax=Staphylococcus TaxID=1279 RepID=UPI00059771C3|nr:MULTISPECIES: hypothetical protein [Staphylococcus]KIJ87312.1 hypothetical protein SE00_03890 [Staphylococcus saprophyticus]MBF2752346.1 hypothetical protein [Staphylococcus saprophyticus]MBF2778483.1 hypothetical protein [Staphylococcus saprophyticus]MBF2781119.1 hypothetical protein [Staphylococcus saprophyticus]MBN6091479.1 hypothetical protein [Staphylococcus saprophyticus]
MDEILEDIKKSAWNFITLIISVFLFFTLKSTVDSFVSQYGAKVKVKNLFVDGYLSGTLSILGLIFITLVLLCATIFFSYLILKGDFSLTAIFQILISIGFIIATLSLSSVPFIGTLIMLIIITIFIYFIINER